MRTASLDYVKLTKLATTKGFNKRDSTPKTRGQTGSAKSTDVVEWGRGVQQELRQLRKDSSGRTEQPLRETDRDEGDSGQGEEMVYSSHSHTLWMEAERERADG